MRKVLALTALAVLLAVCVQAAEYESPITTAQGPWVLQSAATTGNGNTWNTRESTAATVLYIRWSSGCSAGAVVVETEINDQSGSAYTWAPLATVAWSAASKTDVVQILGPIGVVRARISSNVVGGTVTVTAYGR